MFAKHPEIAKRWEDKYGISKNMPQHISKKKIRRKVKKAMKFKKG